MSFADSGETKEIESVIIPEGVVEIGEDAFEYCDSLKRVVLPDGLKKIGVGAFENCALKEINLPESIEEIETLAFYNTEWWDNIAEEFYSVNGLLIKYTGSDMDVVVPDYIKTIGSDCFLNDYH